MINIKDDKNSLIWINYFGSKDTPKKSFWEHFKKKSSLEPKSNYPTLLGTLKTLDTWESSDISKFILPNGDENLGNHIYKKYFDKNREIPAEHNGKTFKLWVAFDEKDLSVPVGITLLSHDNFSNKNYIEYLVVNPSSLRQGNGTRMLKSIGEICASKVQNGEDKNLYTYIRKDNTPSLNLFKKFGFNPIKMDYVEGLTDDILDSPYYPLLSSDFFSTQNTNDDYYTK